ncbi:hypothetical protein JCM19037_3564 [Geomicrobium sp. JCM 19037]|uniref:hypothetical protein n=1 Tax=Geomicrobium sp. JCM 19037 TaxID=1460634 RepID=UPI00045F1C05|nr:hypothetical protein [Geomicrobium sp. JCM 19037]GAK05095.1 hypothetical protein JCM19037_3564 [Geomicrobium sp. JCM 19037]
MIHSVKFLHGLFNTKAHFSTLKESEATKGLAWRLTVGALIIGLITVLSQFAVRDDMMQVYQSMPGMGEEEASIFVSIMMALGGVFAVARASLPFSRLPSFSGSFFVKLVLSDYLSYSHILFRFT